MAPSARNRESVMSLGSIAHLQYYFARTGILDGKGGRSAREGFEARAKVKGRGKGKGEGEGEGQTGEAAKGVPRLLITQQPPTAERDHQGELVESPIDDPDTDRDDRLSDTISDDGDYDYDSDDDVMLPPTVSTYSMRTRYIPPPPDVESLRRDLEAALADANKALAEASSNPAGAHQSNQPSLASAGGGPPGWHEIQGMYILDMLTLAIRAARVYYTSHDSPARLAAIKSDRVVREDLLVVLDTLKRWAARGFNSGNNGDSSSSNTLRSDEHAILSRWTAEARTIVTRDRELEHAERARRAGWTWRRGSTTDWTGREREREAGFLACLLEAASANVVAVPTAALPPLPTWEPPQPPAEDDANGDNPRLPTVFLARLADGRDLVRCHNAAVRLSRRRFGEIGAFHETDTAKPYRRADNLRYWAKAAEIRWEVGVEIDALGIAVAAGGGQATDRRNGDVWRRFDTALLAWCRGVREHLESDWAQEGG